MATFVNALQEECYCYRMKSHWFSRSCWMLSAALILAVRCYYSPLGSQTEFKLSTWDALGYYIYLPAHYIYHEDTHLKWKDSIDRTYQLSGGDFYQASKRPDGAYVFKYMKGVSHLQWPFFLLAHAITLHSSYPADGFSFYYQVSIALAAMVYALLGLFLLRRFLLYYFSDRVTGLTLLLLVFASNAIQYFSVDSGMSHVYIFPLYAAMLLLTHHWHQKARWWNTIGIGLVFGTAVICRPTEAVMLFIPLLWNVTSFQALKKKMTSIQPHHGILLILSVFLAMLPQFIYWKQSTGHWIYDVGSKWDFLTPHWQVLFGWEKGWFIYTPVALLMMAGLFLQPSSPFKLSVMVFIFLNIYILISWHIWRYGASYSCRAMVESYPVLAIPLAVVIHRLERKPWRWFLYGVGLYLIVLNLFQILQYNRGVLHYDDMNRRYYEAIYFNMHPSPLAMSLLDYPNQKMGFADHETNNRTPYSDRKLCKDGDTLIVGIAHSDFVKLHFALNYTEGAWGAYYEVVQPPSRLKFRIEKPLAKSNQWNVYEAIIPMKTREPFYVILHGNPSWSCQMKEAYSLRLSSE